MMLLRFAQRHLSKSKGALMSLILEPQAGASVKGLSSASFGVALVGSAMFATVATSEHALSPNEWRSFRVTSNEFLTHDTRKIRLEFPEPDQTSGMTTASFILTRANLNGKPVVRPYTPTSANSEKGYMELIVKGYPTGAMSKYLVELKEGDSVDVKGPNIKFTYKPSSRKHIAMVAGGSGITPMLQVALEILRNPEDNTDVTIIFGNKTEEDIILRDELSSYEAIYPGLKVVHVLSEPSESWTGYKGFINEEILKEYLPGPSVENLVLVCGPPSMMHSISGGKAKDYSQGQVEGILKNLNYTSEMVFKF
ncbi:NADH-cytochrome b5 reductase [Aphanomyces cochlioides]|nr:NADH-cytochrome b5 reductase [Aphanomyces cochlioides]